MSRLPEMGSGHWAAISMLAVNVTITGEFRCYATTGSSGALVNRNFCPVCGTNVFNSYPGAAGVVSLSAALLDGPEIFAPDVVLFERNALPWDYIDPRIARSDRLPVAKAG